MTQNYNVITSVARMGVGDYEASDFPIGVDQRFVGALLNSHNNNLEEQFLLGLDCVKTEWKTSHGVLKTCRKYYDGKSEDAPKGYYILYTQDFSQAVESGSTSKFFEVEDEYLVFSSKNFISGISHFPSVENEAFSFSSGQSSGSIDPNASIPIDSTDTDSLDEAKTDIAVFEPIPQDYTYPLEYQNGVVFLEGYGASWGQQQATDPDTDNPMVDEETGEPIMEEIPVLILDQSNTKLVNNDAGYAWGTNETTANEILDINPGFVVTAKAELWFRYDTSIESDIPDSEHDTLIADKVTKVQYINNRRKTSDVVTNYL